MQEGAAIAAAGSTAAAAAGSDPAERQAAAEQAVAEKASELGWELSDDECKRIAQFTSSQVVEDIRAAGGFDQPVEPVQPPPAPTGAGTAAAQPEVTPPGAPAPDVKPQGRGSFATWFRSGSR